MRARSLSSRLWRRLWGRAISRILPRGKIPPGFLAWIFFALFPLAAVELVALAILEAIVSAPFFLLSVILKYGSGSVFRMVRSSGFSPKASLHRRVGYRLERISEKCLAMTKRGLVIRFIPIPLALPLILFGRSVSLLRWSALHRPAEFAAAGLCPWSFSLCDLLWRLCGNNSPFAELKHWDAFRRRSFRADFPDPLPAKDWSTPARLLSWLFLTVALAALPFCPRDERPRLRALLAGVYSRNLLAAYLGSTEDDRYKSERIVLDVWASRLARSSMLAAAPIGSDPSRPRRSL